MIKPMVFVKWACLLVLLLAAMGALTLAGDTIQAQSGGQLSYGTSAFGAISGEAPLAMYSFDGAVGDLVTVDAIPTTPTLSPQLTLIGPDGQPVTSSQRNRLVAHSQNAHIAHVLPQSGTYSLIVNALDATVGEFTIRLQGRVQAISTILEFGIPIDVTIPQQAESQFFTFEAEECPTTLHIINLGTGPLFPYVVKVRNEQGREIGLLRGTTVLEDEVTVAALSGWYEVEVRSEDPLAAGQLRLVTGCGEGVPECAPGGEPVGEEPICLPCPSCPEDFEDGDLPECPVMNLTFTPEGSGGLLTWNPVMGIEHYWIHMYGLHEGGGETYLGEIGRPPDATEFFFPHLPDAFAGFRFIIEAVSGDEVICTDETEFLDVFECPDLNLIGEITDPVDRWARWTWNGIPEAEGYYAVLEAVLDDGSIAPIGPANFEPETTAWSTYHGLDVSTADTYRVRMWLNIGGALICEQEAQITFDQRAEYQDCANFSVGITEQVDGVVTLGWPAYPGAEGYWVYFLDQFGLMVPGYPVVLPPDQLSLTVELSPGTYTFGIGPWTEEGRAICLQGITIVVEGGEDAPCVVRTDRRNVWVHVGPGRHRNVFILLPYDQEFDVIGEATDAEGNLWWELDKTQFPGHEAVLSLWVAAIDVIETGDCEDIPQGDIPPIIPEQPPQQQDPPPQDPPPQDPPPQDPPPQDPPPDEPDDPTLVPPPECVAVYALVEPEGLGTAGAITAANCSGQTGNYLPGTRVQVQASAVGGCWLDHWSGCGASGDANPATVVVNSTCVITAHIACIQ